MDGILAASGSALWLGILTSISPCPLATNIAAISYIGKRVDNPRMVLLTGLLYTLGRMMAYLVLGIILVASLLSIPDLSMFLKKYMNKFLGPLLIVAGLFLLELIRINLSGGGLGAKTQSRIDRCGIWGAGLLGIVFALSFCPVSAALFFGSLLPLALKYNSSLVFPLVYGIGTALPVIVFAFLIGFSTRLVGRVFNRITKVEFWARRITGIIFIIVGIYYVLIYIFNLPL